jgi:nitroimidazol reductase NimA-like FMN-containing flavoprotein (pyridoxamine 5'-phosphate oxidase superfamily)
VTDPVEIEQILAATNIGRMATLGADGYPYITPVNFVYFEGKIYFHCAPKGEKLDNIERDPRVCFQVDIPLAYLDGGFTGWQSVCNVHQFYHCVIIRGAARVIDNGPLKTKALNALLKKHEEGAEFMPVHEQLPEYKACAVIEIDPTSISAKSDLVQNRPEEKRQAIARYLKGRNRPGDPTAVRALGFDPEDL